MLTSPSPSPNEHGNLLSDEQVQQFIVNGYLTVHADYDRSFHDSIRQQIDTVLQEEGNPGNNILPRIPDIGRIFDHPNVRGALTSLLGPGYNLNPHRHCHLNRAGSQGQSWHKDCYVYDHNLRHPRFYWILAFYYPQDTTPDMGPSGLLPRTQFYRTISDPNPAETQEEEVGICGPAGTVGLIHFDSWHRAIQNVSNLNRYMLKFQLARMKEPIKPTWNCQRADWTPGMDIPNPEVSRDVWDWLRGDQKNALLGAQPGRSPTSDAQTDRLEAAYQLAGVGASAVPELIGTMREQTLLSIEETHAKTPDNAHGTNPTPSPAATALTALGSAAIPALSDAMGDDNWWVRTVAASALGRMGAEGEEAVPGLFGALEDGHWWVRRNATEALGMIGAYSDELIAAMAKAAGDDDYRVRRNAVLTLAKVGPEADPAVPDILPILSDENRYNRFYGGLALRRIGTRSANRLLLDHLFESRWCSLTTPKDMY